MEVENSKTTEQATDGSHRTTLSESTQFRARQSSQYLESPFHFCLMKAAYTKPYSAPRFLHFLELRIP